MGEQEWGSGNGEVGMVMWKWRSGNGENGIEEVPTGNGEMRMVKLE